MPDSPEERIRALELENELLQLEIEALGEQLATGRAPLEHQVDDARLRELIRAEKDLKRLLRRLGRGIPGLAVRRFGAYRSMVERYLEADE